MTYKSKRKPRAKQAEALKLIEGKKYFALLMGMRTGKTKVVIDDWGRMIRRDGIMDALIIAPGGAYLVWPNELSKDLPDDLREHMWVMVWTSGHMEPQQVAQFLRYQGPRALIVNVEAISAVDAARDLCISFLKSRSGMNLCVVDESVTIKNPDAERTKFVCTELASRAAYRRILSGLPTPRSPLDLFMQYWFLHPSILGFKNYYAFRARHAVMERMKVGVRYIKIVVGYRKVEELNAKIAPHSFRCLLSDCYDMPKDDYSFRDVQMTKEQARIYKDLKERATTELESGDHVTPTIVITQMLRLHQVLLGFVADDETGQVHSIPENRTAELLNLLDDYDGKAIIWCSYDDSVRKVANAISDHFDAPVARFWGGNASTREAEEKRFQEDPLCRWIVGTPAAGRYGRPWHAANLVVYYSCLNDLDHRAQSEERAKADGKKEMVSYVDMRVRGTVEDKIIQGLRDKVRIASKITGDNWKEWLV